MNEFSRRLKKLRERKKANNPRWTQQFVADKIGMARSTYTAYENGTKMPPADTINNIASLLDVSNDYLMGRTNMSNLIPMDALDEVALIPVLSKLSSNSLKYDTEDFIGYMPTIHRLSSSYEYTWLLVNENNMLNMGIQKGSRVLVCLDSPIENGDIAVISVNGQDGIIHKVYFTNENVSLVSENPNYEDITYPKEDVTIIGKVIGLYTIFHD